ncbi:hypothetical protein [uncultured Thiothrix sp.]|jgi:hypothetical protein|uniref:hypothetical protein n=1 Tax=uncultured Thiothrix sp. TaxID=223185 RepID=UPI00262EB315|nr:hypothetical protein [uncultured Thiothrix sp.]HMT93619.1 hypothetical protein [Thiolinea sp.]
MFMLNGDLKESALKGLENAHSAYQKSMAALRTGSEELYTLRKTSSEVVIGAVEGYINTLANTPKEFDRTFAEFRAEYRTFTQLVQQIQKESEKVNVKAGGSVAAGVATGAGVAAFAPTAAMAIATTFGTASTGTAISALGGAAATNAALAWLGGGALAAGGGGMAAGNALLAMAGPVGWAIGGAALVGGAFFARSKNKAIAEEANQKRREIEVYTRQFDTARSEVSRLHSLTVTQVDGMKRLLGVLKSSAPSDYRQFTATDKDRLGALVNHVHSLSALLNKKVNA